MTIPAEWSFTWGPTEEREALSRLLRQFDHMKAMTAFDGQSAREALREQFLTDVLALLIPHYEGGEGG